MSTERRKTHRVAKILVPTDFSAPPEAALDYASFLGGRFAADIDVLFAWNLKVEEDEGSLEMSASLERWLDDGGISIATGPSSPPLGAMQ